MDKIREQFRNPWVAAAVGFVIGLIIGLVVLGWGLWPVQWKDAAPAHLREDAKVDYLCMAVQAFSKDQRADLAAMRWKELGSTAADVLIGINSGNCSASQADLLAFQTAVKTPITAVQTSPTAGGAVLPATTPGAVQPTMAAAGEKTSKNSPVLLIVSCLLVLIIGGALAYIFFFRKRRGTEGTPVARAQEVSRAAERTDFEAEGQDQPVAQFMTTYMAGDDLYDDSFSIDSASGEFLGECGVGISETIGVGDPKKVTAFEVWLFDKNDIQTITKVLMSTHAFNDPAISQRLASKGEPVLVEPGAKVLLETATLQLEARVVDMGYGTGALPNESHFDRLTLELAVWPKTKA
ncbi:hypothetical protein LARV_02173 [Longilinea arvoryzae]|uniref:Uncharacterized protein n=1 Tax=Longilinea arvoryzae TaxID=360412 RepID=A0A0S7BH47_9CHLR|nr:hypothetical protein [Longilinea arvoryzae]GAP14404.1 hypothetical protein LARV_02173 [Longilinea arvoryzae]